MNKSLKISFIMGLVLLHISSCISDDDEKPGDAMGKGSYFVDVQQTEIDSYPGGGGLFILSLTPGEDFEGTVTLSIQADPSLQAYLTTDYLADNNRVTEVEIRPEETTTIEEYIITITTQNTDINKTLNLHVNIVKPDSLGLDGKYAIKRFNEFVQFMQDIHPDLNISTDMDWFSYNHYPEMMPGSPNKWTFLSPTWDITVLSRSGPNMSKWYLIRMREEYDPMLAAYANLDESIHEIPVSEFGGIQ